MRLTLLVGTAFASLAAVPAAFAQDMGARDAAAEDIVVTAEAHRPVDAGKTDVPLIETPQAISVVSADMLRDRGTTRLADALRTVAGVSRSSTYGFFDAYTIRGYDAAYGSVYLDGLLSEAGTGTNNELAGLQQVEVVKGPASALFGSAPLGGIVNLVSKRPQGEAFADLSLSTGSYGLVEGAVDANAPLTRDGSWSARLNAVYRDVGSFVRNSGQNRVYVAPALTWRSGPATSLTVLGVYQRDRDHPFSPLSAWGTVLPSAYGPTPIDFSINNGGGQRPIYNQERASISTILSHRFNDAIGVSQTMRYTHRTSDFDRWLFVAGFLDDEVVDGIQRGRRLGRYYYGPFHGINNDFAIDNRATAKVATGSIRHNLLAGIDYRQGRVRSQGDGDFNSTHLPLDIVTPDYDTPLRPQSSPYSNAGANRQIGYYLQDHVSLTERLTATLGARWDRVTSNDETQTAFSPRVGATYALVPGMVAYAAWARSFTPQFGSQIIVAYDANGNPSVIGQAPPEHGRNIEAGLKIAPSGNAINATVALFDLERQNVLTADLAFPQFSRVVGRQRSRGVEVEGQWSPAPGASLNAAYAYIHATVLNDDTLPAGSELQNIPRQNVSLYGRYVIQDGALANVGGNLGLIYNSSRAGSMTEAYTYRLPSYVLVDTGLSYVIGRWSLLLSVNNILGERYFPDSCCLDRITPGQPRNWRLTLARRL
ncbi:TonB-dependent siderophore receptor [Sphingomonas taxi]|uniref:TonB-dependent siderophore receptor n=1 Tax=Sphingomonas taxi TaxID=1549858 RepID=UPI0006917325|nr:TonB-dependent siderophore receptor [Sphingomonas taxi]